MGWEDKDKDIVWEMLWRMYTLGIITWEEVWEIERSIYGMER